MFVLPSFGGQSAVDAAAAWKGEKSVSLQLEFCNAKSIQSEWVMIAKCDIRKNKLYVFKMYETNVCVSVADICRVVKKRVGIAYYSGI